MGLPAGDRVAKAVPSLRLPALVVLVCLLVTGIVAENRSTAAHGRREALFDSRATAMQDAIVGVADKNVNDFRSGVNFVASTHPGSIEQYQEFFGRELGQLPEGDPGIIMLEEFEIADLAALRSREQAIGNDGFEVTVLPSRVSRKLFVTRTAQDIDLFGLALMGLDVTIVREALLPTGFAATDFELHIVESADLVNFVGGDVSDTTLSELTAVLIAGVVDGEGEFLGYALKVDYITSYLQVLDNVDLEGLNVELWVENLEQPIGQRLSENATPITEADLSSRRSTETASLSWRIDVWANKDFGPQTGLLDQTTILLVGVSVSLAAGLVLMWRDRTERRIESANDELAHVRTLASTDGLTGLLNRAGLVDAAREIPDDLPATMFFLDLDGFKSVNDESGHEHGDRVLVSVAESLSSIFRAGDLVSRLGGDEFVVFTVEAGDAAYVAQISERITSGISEIDHRITASLGVSSRAIGDNTDVKEMLRSADEAMYEAKRAGGDRYTIRA